MKSSLLTVAFILCYSIAHAQNVNPNKVDFAASPDHSVTEGGVDKLTSYEIFVVRESATGTVLVTQDIGKPTPINGVVVGIDLPVSTLPTGTTLLIAVKAKGPGGSSTSPFSLPFVLQAAPASAGRPVTRRQ